MGWSLKSRDGNPHASSLRKLISAASRVSGLYDLRDPRAALEAVIEPCWWPHAADRTLARRLEHDLTQPTFMTFL